MQNLPDSKQFTELLETYYSYNVLDLWPFIVFYSLLIGLLSILLKRKVHFLGAFLGFALPLFISSIFALLSEKLNKRGFEGIVATLSTSVPIEENWRERIESLFYHMKHTISRLQSHYPGITLVYLVSLVLSLTFLKPLRSRGEPHAET